MKLPVCNPIGVIPVQAGIHKILVLLQFLMLDPRLRGDDNRGLNGKVFSCDMSIAS